MGRVFLFNYGYSRHWKYWNLIQLFKWTVVLITRPEVCLFVCFFVLLNA